MHLQQVEHVTSQDQIKDKETRLKGHKLAVTCVVVDSRNQHIYTASKDGSIIRWNTKGPKIVAKVHSISRSSSEKYKDLVQRHHIRHINCLALSSDDKFLASGGWDKLIRIWSPEDLSWLHTFSMHRQEVTALVFRLGHHSLYSASTDRSVMLWTLEDDDNRCFVESLYGHESTITSLDSLRKERVLSSGGLDKSVRVWKIVEQAQTVFESKHESVDIAKYIDDKLFVSGGTEGSIMVWTTMKRTPLTVMVDAHQMNETFRTKHQNIDESRYDQKDFSFWVSSIATYNPAKYIKKNINKRKRKRIDDDGGDTQSEEDQSDGDQEEDEDDHQMNETTTVLIATGSCNSEIKIWRLVRDEGKYGLDLHQTIECHGFINDLCFTKDGRKLIAACGQEHKFGRWWKLKKAKNCLQIFDVNKTPS